jgi:hypothetical protein
MKQCPRCSRTYTDDALNFCLEDGELLQQYYGGASAARPADDAPPTVMFQESRVTNPTNWPQTPPSAPPAPWQQQSPQPAGIAQSAAMPSVNQTLAIVSLGLGAASITIGWCCSTGMLLSPAALITGFIALSQIKKDPRSYGGRGFAIAGIVTGIIYLSVILLIIVIYGAAILSGGLNSLQ